MGVYNKDRKTVNRVTLQKRLRELFKTQHLTIEKSEIEVSRGWEHFYEKMYINVYSLYINGKIAVCDDSKLDRFRSINSMHEYIWQHRKKIREQNI